MNIQLISLTMMFFAIVLLFVWILLSKCWAREFLFSVKSIVWRGGSLCVCCYCTEKRSFKNCVAFWIVGFLFLQWGESSVSLLKALVLSWFSTKYIHGTDLVAFWIKWKMNGGYLSLLGEYCSLALCEIGF